MGQPFWHNTVKSETGWYTFTRSPGSDSATKRGTGTVVGMRDVAKKAGVSLSTVSLVINNGEHVSDDVRSRVEWAMDALNYVPNELARNLSKNRTNMVGVIMPTLRHPFFATLFASLQTALEERGMLALPCSTSDMKRGEEEYIDMLRRRMMDGIITVSYTHLTLPTN